jgi:hypothetical protein
MAVGVLRGSYRGKRGKVVSIGFKYVEIAVPNEQGTFSIRKDYLVRVAHENPKLGKEKKSWTTNGDGDDVPFPYR